MSEDAAAKSQNVVVQGRPLQEQEAKPPIGWRELGAVAAMLLMFVAAQVIAVLLAEPFAEAGVQGFEDPDDWTNGLVLIGIVLVFTAIILFIAKMRREKFIQYIILGSVGMTLVYVFFPLLLRLPQFGAIENIDARFGAAIGIALVPAVVLTILLYKWPEWYIVDIVGVLVAAGGIAIFGTSFTPATYVLVLIGLAVYDYISVYKTKHMLSLADSVINYHLPIMLVVPKHLDYSFLEESTQLRKEAEPPKPAAEAAATQASATEPKRARDAMFLGLGDIVIPSIFAMTALQISALAAFGSMMGTLAGFLFLMTFVLRGKPQAGLPSLNAGALIGFLIGLYADTGSLVFW